MPNNRMKSEGTDDGPYIGAYTARISSRSLGKTDSRIAKASTACYQKLFLFSPRNEDAFSIQ